jgi:hypothetical protein
VTVVPLEMQDEHIQYVRNLFVDKYTEPGTGYAYGDFPYAYVDGAYTCLICGVVEQNFTDIYEHVAFERRHRKIMSYLMRYEWNVNRYSDQWTCKKCGYTTFDDICAKDHPQSHLFEHPGYHLNLDNDHDDLTCIKCGKFWKWTPLSLMDIDVHNQYHRTRDKLAVTFVLSMKRQPIQLIPSDSIFEIAKLIRRCALDE